VQGEYALAMQCNTVNLKKCKPVLVCTIYRWPGNCKVKVRKCTVTGSSRLWQYDLQLYVCMGILRCILMMCCSSLRGNNITACLFSANNCQMNIQYTLSNVCVRCGQAGPTSQQGAGSNSESSSRAGTTRQGTAYSGGHSARCISGE
jgi:hypothetical protein